MFQHTPSKLVLATSILSAAALMSSTALAGESTLRPLSSWSSNTSGHSQATLSSGHIMQAQSSQGPALAGAAPSVVLPDTFRSTTSRRVVLPDTFRTPASSRVVLPDTFSHNSDRMAVGSVAPVPAAGPQIGISAPYTLPHTASGSSSLSTGHVTNFSVPGLGPNERLCQSSCPTAVQNPEKGRVLGCYQVCKPAPVRVQNYVRVVRPIIYVRYPVPVAVRGCGQQIVTHYSRYGAPNYTCRSGW